MLLARTTATSLFLAAALSMAVSTAMAQTGVHPGFTITNLRPSGFNPMVSGLDFLPDGRLVVSTWGRIVESRGGVGPMELVSKAEYRHGVYLLTLKNGAGVSHQRIVKP